MKAKIIIFLCLMGLAACDEETQSTSETQQRVESIEVASSTENLVSKKPTNGPWMQFRVCKIDTDCVVAIGVCGVPVSISGTQMAEFSKQVDRVSKIVKCAPPPLSLIHI